MPTLKLLAKDCEFESVTATQNRDDYIRDSFINGLSSTYIRQRLLENKTLNLENAYNNALTLEMAHKHSEAFNLPINAAVTHGTETELTDRTDEPDAQLSATGKPPYQAKCYFCGLARHPRSRCPAKEAECHKCKKIGHYGKVCRSNPVNNKTVAHVSRNNDHPTLATIVAASPHCLSKALFEAKINGISVQALIDTGSSESFVNEKLVNNYRWSTTLSDGIVSMASTSFKSEITRTFTANLEIEGSLY